MSNYEIIAINEDPLDVGTRIHWDEDTLSVYYVDVPNSTVYRYDTQSGRNFKAKVGKFEQKSLLIIYLNSYLQNFREIMCLRISREKVNTY